MKVVLRKSPTSDTQIERKFIYEPSDPHWKAFLSLNVDVLAENDRPVLEELQKQKKVVFFDFVNVPWYFDEVGSHVLKNRTECCLRVKACGEFHFIQLSDRSGKLIGTPFFHRFRSKTEDSAFKEIKLRDPKDLRGPGDLLLFLSVTLNDAKNDKQASEVLSWFDLELKIQPASGGEIEVKPNLVWPPRAANWDTFGDPEKYWETFGDPDKYFIKYSPSDKDKILVASRNVRDAVDRIAEVWHNPSVTSVLLSAWTGSGKEPLQRLFMHGMQQSESSLQPFPAPSLAREGRSAPEQIAEALVKSNLTEGPTRTWSRGKCRFESIPGKLKRRTVVFVDEIHHPSAQSVREALLVLMETSKFDHKKKSYDCKGQLMFLFAASEAPEELRRRDPVDFWTRIEHTIRMSHPLNLKLQIDRTLALQQYFGLFWKRALMDGGADALYASLAGQNCVSLVGAKFADLFNSPFIPIISIRMIRSIVNRIANRAIYDFKTDKISADATKTADEQAKETGEQIRDALEGWVKELFDEIVPSIQPKGAF